MATRKEIAQKFAGRLREAARLESLNESQALTKTAKKRARVDSFVQTAAEIQKDIAAVKRDGQPLTKSDIAEYYRLISEDLGLDDPQELRLICEASKNDAYMDMLDQIDQIVSQIRGE
jgi:hypothetical protein